MQLKSKIKQTARVTLCIGSGQPEPTQAYFVSHFLCLAFVTGGLFWVGFFFPPNADDAEVTVNTSLDEVLKNPIIYICK